ncbi:hypothetical protein DAPPUDRAFT_261890 [Daphnia pulex]|uniref:Uncharacterized protein n=1 Tax=Daphnia pulex TaxID=6669 RepID=E9HLW0_DAPPU|nr:hypothetical protein DAPPUDRAFT_261890 [Daphnia pulex]|eukprot:EFX67274.1 hypothetical protein DAPPUDRAFT_261890 [Daphnia pulex]
MRDSFNILYHYILGALVFVTQSFHYSEDFPAKVGVNRHGQMINVNKHLIGVSRQVHEYDDISNTMTPDSVENDTEIQTISKSIPAKGVPLGIPFSKFNWSDESNNITTSTGDSSDPVFVIDASAVANLPTLNDSPIPKNYNELPKRIPLESDMYNIPKININFVLDTGSQDTDMIPPSKSLEVFISRISSEIINFDAVLVTGYPRNMRDVVEYMARVELRLVQRISGVILLKDPIVQLFECDDDSANDEQGIENDVECH